MYKWGLTAYSTLTFISILRLPHGTVGNYNVLKKEVFQEDSKAHVLPSSNLQVHVFGNSNHQLNLSFHIGQTTSSWKVHIKIYLPDFFFSQGQKKYDRNLSSTILLLAKIKLLLYTYTISPIKYHTLYILPFHINCTRGWKISIWWWFLTLAAENFLV